MFLKLSPERIAEKWDAIKQSIEASLPPIGRGESVDRMNNLYKALFADHLECWILYKGEEAQCLVTLQLWTDSITMLRSLLIYSFHSYSNLSLGMFRFCIQKAIERARLLRCSKIITYSKNEKMYRLLEALGGNAETRLVVLEV